MDTNRIVKILCASDRLNYGDLLFPIILEKILSNKGFVIQNYAMKKSDLTFFGALKTKSIFNLISDIKYQNKKIVIIIAGGEVLGSKWENILSYISLFWEKTFNIIALRRFFKKFRILENLCNQFLYSKYPFIFNRMLPVKFNNIEICYNSVGALGINSVLKEQVILDYFKNIKVLSVRDFKSNDNFNALNLNSKLVPDSAIIMSDLFSKELEKIQLNEKLGISNDEYIFLQMGKYKGPSNLNSFIKVLDKYSKNNKLKVLLSPIGLAPKHEDDIVLKEIQKISGNFLYHEPKNVYETMALIKNAKLYIGSSLHGMITAQSYKIQFLALTEKVKKTQHYIDTWINNPSMHYVEDYDFFEQKLNSLDYHSEINDFEYNLAIQKKMVYENINSFFK